MPRTISDDDRARKRQSILDAAAYEIARLGYERANINTIAERAGIGRGTIYLYFTSKEEVLSALLDAIGRQIDDMVTSALTAELSWSDRLVSLARSFAAFARDHEDFLRVHVSALHGVNREVGAPMVSWLNCSTARLAEGLTEGMVRGEIRRLPPVTLALYILGSLESLALLPHVLAIHPDVAPDDVSILASLLWRGIAPIPAT